MRFMGGFLLFFLILIMSGTVSYMYIMWTNYWMRVQSYDLKYFTKNNHPRGVINQKQKRKLNVENIVLNTTTLPSVVKNSTSAPPKKKKVKINLSKLPKDKLMAHIRAYK